MIMPIDIDKKEFSRDKKGYNSREVDEFLDLIVQDYEKVLNDNRAMAHKIKTLEKQLEEAQKSDNAMVDTLETAKKLMADISASAERRAELMMRDAELEAENMMLEAKVSVRKLNDEHLVLKNKVERLRNNYKAMLEGELRKMESDEYELLPDLDRSDISAIDEGTPKEAPKSPTIVVTDEGKVQKDYENSPFEAEPAITASAVAEATAAEAAVKPVEAAPANKNKATLSDLSASLKKMAEEPVSLNDTIILK